jgi:hypothetical protein
VTAEQEYMGELYLIMKPIFSASLMMLHFFAKILNKEEEILKVSRYEKNPYFSKYTEFTFLTFLITD